MTENNGFTTLGIAPKLIDVIDQLKLTSPTPIQAQAIPPGIAGNDVIGIAQTGTGKTLAFGIPLIQRLASSGGQALILLPTRELALQVYETLGKFARPLNLRGAVLIGGAPMNPQIRDLRGNPNVIIATPGRLIDHLQQKTTRLDRISILVLDEADRMLDMGFAPQIKQILAEVPSDKQTMLFSATASKEIMQLARSTMKTPISIEVSPSGTTAENVSQEFFMLRRDEKMRLMETVLGKHAGSTIVFVRTKHSATRIMKGIRAMGHSAAEIHSNRSLGQRREALEGFKLGRYRVLVATDIAARGLDVKGVALVINYDIPTQAEDYVHRIGRTARAGAAGHAISFVTPEERRDMRDIERFIRMSIPMSMTPDLPPSRALAPEDPREAPRGFGRSIVRSSRSPSFASRSPRTSSRSASGASRGGRPPFRSGSRPRSFRSSHAS